MQIGLDGSDRLEDVVAIPQGLVLRYRRRGDDARGARRILQNLYDSLRLWQLQRAQKNVIELAEPVLT